MARHRHDHTHGGACLRQLAAVTHLIVLLLCLAGQVRGYSVHVPTHAKIHIAQHVKTLPVYKHALADMSEAQRKAWAHDQSWTINQTLALLSSPKVTVTVDVKLVGFHGDGAEGLYVHDHELLVFLRSLHNQMETVALHPEPARLAVKPEIQFRVQPAFHELAQHVTSAVNEGLRSSTGSTSFTDYPLQQISYSTVDSIIQKDFDATDFDGSYAIYILNPAVKATYAYTYDTEGHGCPGSLWVSDKRYAWFDLSANLTFYGPGPGGKGAVFQHSVPVLKHYKPEAASKAIIPDLVGLVWSACQHLIWPPVHHERMAYHREVNIHVIYMHQSLRQTPGRIDAAAMKQALQSAVGDAQDISVQEHWLSFAACDHCVTAYSGALKTKMSRSPAANKQFKMDITRFLDVVELERWLKEWRDSVMAYAGIHYSASEADAHVLPVFVFDVDTASKDAILLDGVRQAAALESGDVVAVRSNAPSVPTFFGCFDGQVHINPKDIHRPILGAVLQAGLQCGL
eukprot:jgi/Chrzof1/7777/Cz02g36110.t1